MPEPSEPTEIQVQILEELDETILLAVKSIKQELKSGTSIKDLKGAGIILNVARQRLKDKGIAADMVPGGSIEKLMEDIGPIDEVPPSEEDDAASKEPHATIR